MRIHLQLSFLLVFLLERDIKLIVNKNKSYNDIIKYNNIDINLKYNILREFWAIIKVPSLLEKIYQLQLIDDDIDYDIDDELDIENLFVEPPVPAKAPPPVPVALKTQVKQFVRKSIQSILDDSHIDNNIKINKLTYKKKSIENMKTITPQEIAELIEFIDAQITQLNPSSTQQSLAKSAWNLVTGMFGKKTGGAKMNLKDKYIQEYVKIYKTFFDENFIPNEKVDLIVHSHLLEHIIDINGFYDHHPLGGSDTILWFSLIPENPDPAIISHWIITNEFFKNTD